MSELVHTSQQVANLRVTDKSAAFLVTLQDMNRRLGVLYQLSLPVLHRRITDHSKEQCQRIEVWITTVKRYLELSKELVEVGDLMEPFLQPNQVVKMKELLAVMDIWGVEMDKAVASMQNALEKSTLTLAGLVLEEA